MIYNKQPHIEYGFIDFNNKTWCSGWVDSYNGYTDVINKYTGRNIKTDSLCDMALQFALDQRHRFMVYCTDFTSI